MEASLSYRSGATLYNAIPTPAYSFVVGFTATGDALDPNLRSPANFLTTANSSVTANNSFYGMAYRPTFTGSQGRGLSAITESSTDGMQTSGTWICAQRFMIVRGVDAKAVRFQKDVDPLPSTSIYNSYYLQARRVLRAEDWALSYEQGMAVYNGNVAVDPCYLNAPDASSSSRHVNYSAGLNCTNSPSSAYVCPHYVTICTRN